MQSALRRPIAALVAASMLALALPAPVQAGDVPADLARERIELLLVKNGVGVGEARARVAALTDEEVVQVAAEFDQLPAGGNPAIVALLYAFAWVVAIGFMAVFKLVEAVVEEARK
jgi:hypothetical protein